MRLLSAVLALAALALLPMAARAETSHENVYVPAIPHLGGTGKEPSHESPAPQSDPGTEARQGGQPNSPTTTGEAGEEATTGPEEGPESKSGHKHHHTTTAVRGDHHGDGGSPPEEGGSSKSPSGTGPEKTEQFRHGPTDVGGGSSPVLPILIALVVLATISIGVVVYRERRPTG